MLMSFSFLNLEDEKSSASFAFLILSLIAFVSFSFVSSYRLT